MARTKISLKIAQGIFNENVSHNNITRKKKLSKDEKSL